MGNGLHPGSLVFVGQYLFTGAETTSAYLTVAQASTKELQSIMLAVQVKNT